MKLFSTLLLFLCFLFVAPLSAQSEPDINELIARSKITTFKSIHEVFTPKELTMLREYYNVAEVTNSAPERGGNTWVYSTEDQSGAFGTFDLADPSTFNMITTSPAPAFEGAGAISDAGDIAYSIDSDNNFYSIDIQTGAYNFIGKVTPPNGETFTGLEMDPTDNNKLYAISSDGANSSLSTIDPLTQLVTFIGLTTLVVAISLAITTNGDLYTMDIDDDKLYKINKLTAAILLIGYIGFDANFGQGMARDALTGNIFMAAFNNTVFDSELRLVNLVNAVTVLIGVIILGTLAQFGWMGIPDASLGVDDNSISHVVLFPNPTGDLLNLRAGVPIESVSIYNILGQQLLDKNIGALYSQLDISNLSSGQYLIKTTVNGQTEIHKIVKQ
ncbi:MAG: T9SS type A sorting domain-containing protein [Bacteroidetes bacterium]|nr:T9SS type A sorting domain-containing protein [Bacteroidota bacterium]